MHCNIHLQCKWKQTVKSVAVIISQTPLKRWAQTGHISFSSDCVDYYKIRIHICGFTSLSIRRCTYHRLVCGSTNSKAISREKVILNDNHRSQLQSWLSAKPNNQDPIGHSDHIKKNLNAAATATPLDVCISIRTSHSIKHNLPKSQLTGNLRNDCEKQQTGKNNEIENAVATGGSINNLYRLVIYIYWFTKAV